MQRELTPLEIYRRQQMQAALAQMLAADQARRVAHCVAAWAQRVGG